MIYSCMLEWSVFKSSVICSSLLATETVGVILRGFRQARQSTSSFSECRYRRWGWIADWTKKKRDTLSHREWWMFGIWNAMNTVSSARLTCDEISARLEFELLRILGRVRPTWDYARRWRPKVWAEFKHGSISLRERIVFMYPPVGRNPTTRP